MKPGERTFTFVGETGISLSYRFSTNGQLLGLELPEELTERMLELAPKPRRAEGTGP
jgi:hypothetical protein